MVRWPVSLISVVVFLVPALAFADGLKALDEGKLGYRHHVEVPYADGGVEFPFVAYDADGQLVTPAITVKPGGKVDPTVVRFEVSSDAPLFIADKPLLNDGAAQEAVTTLTEMLAGLQGRPECGTGSDLVYEVAEAQLWYAARIPFIEFRATEVAADERYVLVNRELWYTFNNLKPFVTYDDKGQPTMSRVRVSDKNVVSYFFDSQTTFEMYPTAISGDQWDHQFGDKKNQPLD